MLSSTVLSTNSAADGLVAPTSSMQSAAASCSVSYSRMCSVLDSGRLTASIVADTMTPSVPSEPTMALWASAADDTASSLYPDEFFGTSGYLDRSIRLAMSHIPAAASASSGSLVRPPVPSTIVIPDTLSMVAPYFRLLLPAALFATMPPTVQNGPTDGFGPNIMPAARKTSSSLPLVAPAPASTEPPAGPSRTILIPLMFLMSSIIPQLSAPPTSPVPPPLAVMGAPISAATLTAADTSSTSRGITTTSGLTAYELESTE